MTKFENGPAAGQVLSLRRAPFYLRAVVKDGKWDALDQPEDTPDPGETLYAYRLKEPAGMCHIYRGRNGSGFYAVATYVLVPDQPTQELMRDGVAWKSWLPASHEELIRPFKVGEK